VRELTSAYEDLEKRLGIFTGLGAFLFSSLVCQLTGAELETYVIRGVLAMLVFGLGGWWYGNLLRRLVAAAEEKAAMNPDTTITSHDVKSIPGLDLPLAQESAGAEESGMQAVDYSFPEFPTSEAAPSEATQPVETAPK
jgi:hypothetical protein